MNGRDGRATPAVYQGNPAPRAPEYCQTPMPVRLGRERRRRRAGRSWKRAGLEAGGGLGKVAWRIRLRRPALAARRLGSATTTSPSARTFEFPGRNVLDVSIREKRGKRPHAAGAL